MLLLNNLWLLQSLDVHVYQLSYSLEFLRLDKIRIEQLLGDTVFQENWKADFQLN